MTGSVDSAQLVLRVKNSGSGLAESAPRGLRAFVQGESTLDRHEQGLGIGLTLVQRLVELHGGSVTAHSAGGNSGTEFVVRLPVAEARESGTPEGARTRSPRVAHRILVVDDNVDVAEGAAMLLTLEGHTVQVAHDGPAALRLAEEFRPDTVLLDLGLPRMDGYEVARRLKEAD